MGTNTAGNILVADGTNFNSVAVGGLSEISTVADDDVFLAVDTSGGGLKKIARSAVVSGLATSSAISNVVDDTSPQLGANLDTNSHNILIDDAHFIGDENGNEQIIFQTTSSAVNQFDVTNAATGAGPKLSATGGDSNIDLDIEAKGTGHVTIRGNTNSGTIQFNCENNSHGQQIKGAAHSVASSAVVTIPDVTGDMIVGKIGGTDFSGGLLIGHATTGTLNGAQSNTGVGIETLDALTSSDENTAVGYRAGTVITTGSRNTAIGSAALKAMVSGTDNTAIGKGSLVKATGSFNTAIGESAGDEIVGGSHNLTIGNDSGDNITTGSGNVIIGSVDAAAADSARTLKIAGYDGSTTTTWIQGDSSGNLTFAADVTLGDDLHLDSDAAVLKFGDDGEITLTHVADTGLALKHTATADDKPIKLTLQTGETDIAANDVLGAINFQAPDEGTGTDAILVAAGIEAVSEGDFAADNNATKLSFKTAASAAAAETMSLSSDGTLTVSHDVILANNSFVQFGDAGENIAGDGTDLALTSSAKIDLKLGSGNPTIAIYSDGTQFGHIKRNSGNFDIRASESDADITLRGNDGGSAITALTLDMSDAGTATFNHDIKIADGGQIGSASDADAMAISSAGVVTFSGAANFGQQALTSSSNAVAWDASAKPNAFHVTTENTTFSAPSNNVEGAFIALEINYNGSHTIAFNTIFEFAASTAPTFTSTDGKTDILVFRYNGSVWQEVGRTLNLSES